jgi:hypothetical protein
MKMRPGEILIDKLDSIEDTKVSISLLVLSKCGYYLQGGN